jgi:hypothetical protein
MPSKPIFSICSLLLFFFPRSTFLFSQRERDRKDRRDGVRKDRRDGVRNDRRDGVKEG